MRSLFAQKVSLLNKGAKENGYADMSQLWIKEYEDIRFESKFDGLFTKIKPLYKQLHSYVRRQLKEFYGAKYFSNTTELIPAHLLGKFQVNFKWLQLKKVSEYQQNFLRCTHRKHVGPDLG